MTEAKKLFDLTGRVAIVTGAGSGLGKDACTGYVESGANVALLDVNIAAAEEAAKALNEKYGRSQPPWTCRKRDWGPRQRGGTGPQRRRTC